VHVSDSDVWSVNNTLCACVSGFKRLLLVLDWRYFFQKPGSDS